MPKGSARKEPIGIWRLGASAGEQVQAARRWAAQIFRDSPSPPPFHGGEVAALRRMT